MSRAKTTSWHLVFQSLDVGLSIVSGLILIPLYLQFISEATYGAWLATGNILVWITALDPGLTAVIEQRVASAYGEGDTEEVTNTIGAGLLFGAVISLGIVVVGSSFSVAVVSLLDLSPSINGSIIRDAFRLAVVGSALLVFSYALSGIDQGLQGTFGAGIAGVVAKAVGIGARIMLLYRGYGLFAIPWGNIAGAVASVLGYGGYLMYRIVTERSIQVGFTWRKARRLFELMSYNFFGKAANILSNNADSFIIARYIGAETVTIYRLTKKIPDLGNMFLNRVSVAFKPATSHLIGSRSPASTRPVLIRLILYLTWATGLGVGGILALNEIFVELWVGSEIYAGGAVNILLCGLLFVRAVYDSLSNICYSLGNIKGNSIANTVQATVYVIFVLIGAKKYGIIGVAFSAILAHLAVSVWYYPYIFAHIIKAEWGDFEGVLSEVIVVAFVSTLLVSLSNLFDPYNWLSFLLAVVVYIGFYGVSLVILSSAFRREVLNVYNKVKP